MTDAVCDVIFAVVGALIIVDAVWSSVGLVLAIRRYDRRKVK